eukprot:TRINITY_DN4747_c0_g1_i1.p1 TRINITY_DN4747_c0_g1~~TRINITY_DN4747_c0_g1_i1.p1  ORF type:complete len:749 (-),score=81.11 TRINITY_DN4747_c0_g1_i1:111-2177(-)
MHYVESLQDDDIPVPFSCFIHILQYCAHKTRLDMGLQCLRIILSMDHHEDQSDDRHNQNASLNYKWVQIINMSAILGEQQLFKQAWVRGLSEAEAPSEELWLAGIKGFAQLGALEEMILCLKGMGYQFLKQEIDLDGDEDDKQKEKIFQAMGNSQITETVQDDEVDTGHILRYFLEPFDSKAIDSQLNFDQVDKWEKINVQASADDEEFRNVPRQVQTGKYFGLQSKQTEYDNTHTLFNEEGVLNDYLLDPLQRKYTDHQRHQQAQQYQKENKTLIPPYYQKWILDAFSTTANAQIENRDFKRAANCLQEMDRFGIFRDQHTFDIMVKLIKLTGGSAEDIRNLIGEMLRQGLVPSEYACCTLLKSNKDDVKSCYRDFNEVMRIKGGPKGVQLYNTLLGVMVGARDYLGTVDVYKRLRTSGEKPTIETYIRVFQAARAQGQILKMLTSQAEGNRSKVQSEDQLNKYKNRRIDLAKSIVNFQHEMEQNNLTHNSQSLLALLQAYASVKYYQDSIKLIEEVINSPLWKTLQVEHFKTAVGTCSAAGSLKSAQTLVGHMQKIGVKLNSEIYVYLIHLSLKEGRIRIMEQYFKELQQGQFQLSQELYQSLIITFAKANYFDRVLQLTKEMLNKNMLPNERTWKALFTCALQSSRQNGIQMVLKLIPKEEKRKWRSKIQQLVYKYKKKHGEDDE